LNDAEDHLFFQGQIGVLLAFAKEGEVHRLDKFKQYAKRAKELFNQDERVPDSPFLLQRTLLTKGYYLVPVGSSCSFGSNREEWRRIFRERPEPLRLLLEALETQLPQDIIDYAINHPFGDWRDYFIRYPAAFEFCKERRIRWSDEGRHILLVERKRLGPRAELRSYCFYLEHLKDKCQEWGLFKADYQRHSDPHAYLEHPSGKCRIEIRHPQESHLECYFQVRILSSNSSIPEILPDGWDQPSLLPEQFQGWKIANVKWFKDESATLAELKRIVSVSNHHLQQPLAESLSVQSPA